MSVCNIVNGKVAGPEIEMEFTLHAMKRLLLKHEPMARAFFTFFWVGFCKFSINFSVHKIESLILLFLLWLLRVLLFHGLNLELEYSNRVHSYTLFWWPPCPLKPVPDSKGAYTGSPTTKRMTAVICTQLKYYCSSISLNIQHSPQPNIEFPKQSRHKWNQRVTETSIPHEMSKKKKKLSNTMEQSSTNYRFKLTQGVAYT